MHNDQRLANTFEICDTIPSLNLNLFSGQPHSDIVRSIPLELELALHVPIVPTVSDEEYPNCAKSFPQFSFSPREDCRSIVGIAASVDLTIFLSENTTMGRSSAL